MSEDNQQRTQYLFQQYISNRITEEEFREFWQMLRIESLGKPLSENLQLIWDEVKNYQPVISQEKWDSEMKELMAEDKRMISPGKKEKRPIAKIGFMGWAAAVVAILVSGIIFFQYKQHLFNKNATDISSLTGSPSTDILPGGNKAILTLSNGSSIILDSTTHGVITHQGGSTITGTGSGSITYQKNTVSAPEAISNTLSTPRGGQYQITLPDGTKAWLNSASSLRFPSFFSGKMREVQMTGEIYFEIAKDAVKPFEVQVGSMKIRVLGTHFNVNAYSNTDEIKTTLLSGAVSIREGNASVILAPGEQAQVNKGGKIDLLKNINVDEAIAWKNNLFWFQDNTIQEVMRDVSRWYNVDVTIKGNIPQHFTGSIPRDVKVSKVFEVLQETGNIHFQIEDNTIIVTP